MKEYEKLLSKLEDIKNIATSSNVKNIHINLFDEYLDTINISREKTMSKKIYIPIIGSMKSGKSTFINALLGNDIMPSENEACTIAPAYINLKENYPNSICKKFNNKEEDILSGKDISKIFLEDVRKYRKDIRDNKIGIEKSIKNYSLSSKMQCIKNKTSYEIYFIDCPGVNELQFNEKFEEYMNTQVDKAIKLADYIIYVLDVQYFKSEENEVLLKNIIQKNDNLKDNILFVLNKTDLIKNNDDINNLIDDLHKTLKKIGFDNPVIFPTSSILALISRKIVNNKLSDSEKENYYKEYIKENYNKEKVEINGEILYKVPSDLKLSEILLDKSNVQKIEIAIQNILFDFEKNKDQRYNKEIYRLDKKLNNIFESIIYELNDEVSKKIEYFNMYKNGNIDIENIRFNKKYNLDLKDLDKNKLQKIIERKEKSFDVDSWENDCRNLRCMSMSSEFDKSDFNSMNRFCESLRESFRDNTQKYFKPLEDELFDIRKELIDKYMKEVNSKLPKMLYDIVKEDISEKCKIFNIENNFFISKFKFYPENLQTIMLDRGLMEVVINRDFKRHTIKVKLSKSDISEYGERGLIRKKGLESSVAKELVYIFKSQLGMKIELYFNENYDRVLESIKQKANRENKENNENRKYILDNLKDFEDILDKYIKDIVVSNLANKNIIDLKKEITNKKLAVYIDNKEIDNLNKQNLTVVFNQVELDRYLKDTEISNKKINVALCGEVFEISEKVKNIRYIGVNCPTVFINSTSKVIDFYKNNISFENIVLASHRDIIVRNKNIENIQIDKSKIKIKKDMDITYCKTFASSESDFLDNWIFIDKDGKVKYNYNGSHIFSENLPNINSCTKKIVDLDVSHMNVVCVDEKGGVEFICSTFNAYYDPKMTISKLPKIKQISLVHQDMTILLDEDGKVYYYGIDEALRYIKDKDKNKTFSIPKFNSRIVQIDSKEDVMLALDENGKVYIWGIKNDENYPLFNVPKDLPFIVKAKIYKDGLYVLALDEFGKLHGWGNYCVEDIDQDEFNSRRADTFNDENEDFIEVGDDVEFCDLGTGNSALDTSGNMYVFLGHSCKYAYRNLSNKKRAKKLMEYVRICEDNSIGYNNSNYKVMLPRY